MPEKIDNFKEKQERQIVLNRKELVAMLKAIMKTKLDFHKNAIIKLIETTSADQRIKWDPLIDVMFDRLYYDIIEFQQMSVFDMTIP